MFIKKIIIFVYKKNLTGNNTNEPHRGRKSDVNSRFTLQTKQKHSVRFSFRYLPKKDSNNPATMAEPMTPATLGPMACISK